MTLDRNLQDYRERYYEACDADREAIDNAVGTLVNELKYYGFDTPSNDLLENVVTAVVKYLVEAGNTL